jgi:hypothetical protein
MFLQIKDKHATCSLLGALFNTKLPFGLLDEYSPLCHHRLQGRIYLLGLPYIHHKKRGYFPHIDSNKENTSVRKEVKKRTTNHHNFIKHKSLLPFCASSSLNFVGMKSREKNF